jgi:hypothetical protein
MREFKSFTMIREPLEKVWAVMRDRLPEVAESMNDLSGIEVLERSFDAERIRLVNRWTARQTIPSFLRGSLGSESIQWIDRAEWVEKARLCRWVIEPTILKGYIECGGSTKYEMAMAGRGTRVNFEGYFNLQPGFARVVPASLEPLVGGFIESIVSTVIPRNLARAVVTAGELIARGVGEAKV